MSLDDIVQRNRQANRGSPYHYIMRLFDGFQRTAPPSAPDAPFTLRRAKRTSPLLVIPVLLLMAAVVGLYTCSNMDQKTEYELRMQGR